METSLRPMSLGEILDRTAQLYRQKFLLFAGIASAYAGVLLVVGLAETGVQEWLRVGHKTGAIVWSSGVAVMVTYLAMFVFGAIAVAANNRAVAWLHLGEPATIRSAYQSVLPRLGRYLWLGFLKAFFAWFPVVAIYAGLIAVLLLLGLKGLFNQAGGQPTVTPPASTTQAMVSAVLGVVLVLLMLPAVVYGIIMELRYSLAVPASVVENLSARAAIKRSIELSKFSRGRIFVLRLLVWVIEFGLVSVTQSFFFIAAIKNHGQLAVGWRVLQQFVGFCTNSFVTPILATGLTLFYFDQRVRKEGYDIEWMMQAAGMTVPVQTGGAGASVEESAVSPPEAITPLVMDGGQFGAGGQPVDGSTEPGAQG